MDHRSVSINSVLRRTFIFCVINGFVLQTSHAEDGPVFNVDQAWVMELAQRMVEIEKAYSSQKADIEAMRQKLSIQDIEIKSTRDENEFLKKEVQDLRTAVETSRLHSLQKDNNERKSKLRSTREVPEAGSYDPVAIAFTTKLQHHAYNLRTDDVIIFDTEVTNLGGGYDNHTGVFTAPMSGIYVLHYTLVAMYQNNTHAALVHNGKVLSSMFVDGFDNRFDSASQTLAVELEKGDEVFVKHVDDLKSITGGGHSLFTGFLLFKKYGKEVYALG